MQKIPFEAAIYDLDGIITKTAVVHSEAWKATFDEYLRLREKRDNEPFIEFTYEKDYLGYVDGKPRYKGVQSFLESRNINIPFGDPSDEAGKETCCGIGNRKNEMFRKILETRGADIFPTTVELIKKMKSEGVRVGIASSSKNCSYILKASGLEDMFETQVDGVVSAELGLKGKPEGDIFVTAAKNMGSSPERSIVFEDATSGVAAGKNGGFGLVVGVARENNEKELYENGADVVVRDLEEAPIEKLSKWFFDKNP